MNAQDYERKLREIYDDALNRKNLSAYDQIFSQDVIMHDEKETISGLENTKNCVRERSEAIPDFHCTIDDIIISGEKAAVRWHCTGTAIKDFADFKAGKAIHYQGITLFEAKNDRISRLWPYGTTMDV